jgi:hypothetical protein
MEGGVGGGCLEGGGEEMPAMVGKEGAQWGAGEGRVEGGGRGREGSGGGGGRKLFKGELVSGIVLSVAEMLGTKEY